MAPNPSNVIPLRDYRTPPVAHGAGRSKAPETAGAETFRPPLPHERLAQEVCDVCFWTAITLILIGIASWLLP